MGFRQKSRGIRFGLWEYIALALAACTLLSAFLWWRGRNSTDWEPALAHVVGLSLVENNRQISAARPYLQIYFEYVADGRIYRGRARLDGIIRATYDAVPEEVLTLLHTKGYMSFADLPPNIQAMLRRRGIERLDDVPEALLDTLRAQGIHSVREFPDDVRRLVDGNHTAKDPRMRVSAAPPDSPSGAVAPVTAGALIQVRYDPRDPARNAVARFPQFRGVVWPVLFAVFVVLSILYCGLFYPRVKQR